MHIYIFLAETGSDLKHRVYQQLNYLVIFAP